MKRKIYLTGIEKKPGKSFVSLGFLAALQEQNTSVHCYKLFSEIDNTQLALLEHLTKTPVSSLMPVNEGIAMLRTQSEDLMTRVFETCAHHSMGLHYFEGTDFESDNAISEFQFNVSLASQLNAEVVIVISAKDRTLEHTFSLLNTALEMAKKHHAHVIGAIINRVQNLETVALDTRYLQPYKKSLSFLTLLPEFDELSHPCVQDIADTLQATVLYGKTEMNRPVRQFTIAAKTVGNFLESRIDRSGMLIITPSDRIDILLGSLLADQSAYYPKIAGIVLTGGDMPGQVICEILSGLESLFPVMLVKSHTYDTATRLFSAKFSLSDKDLPKVHRAIDTVKPYFLEPVMICAKHALPRVHQSPAVFLYELTQKARKVKRHIVLPEGNDPRILTAASYLLKRNIVDITLLGKHDAIHRLAKRLDLELPLVHIIDIETDSFREAYAQQYFELRRHKNMSLPIAYERMMDVNYYAVMMVYNQRVDGMVSGAVHTTADTVRPALEIIKTKPGISKVSSIFIMCLPDRVVIYGDCAINPEPDSTTLADIALQAADIAERLGLTPKVALLSYSSGDSGQGASVEKVVDAMEIIRSKRPCLLAEGPIQYDAAVDPLIARKKLPHSKLAGDANVLIFPDLNTGNNTYKAVQRETGALAIGPVLSGLNKPVNDLSRGCTAQDIINTVLVTALQSEGESL